MADYDLKAKITADTSGFEAGIKKAQKASKNLSSTVSGVINGLGKNGLVGALGAVGLASSGLTATLGTVIKVARQVSQAIGECTEAYKKQIIAERQLETSINNNPFVSGASLNSLKQFASEMQRVSNYGDEELIPMMANLVSLGRTEDETMKIMAVALDMSASGSMSLDTAINQLNATLNGNIGRLGQQNAELKGLTEEELKSGKAVEILGEKFKGLSSATVDTSKQLKNLKGDFKEAIGEFTLPSSDMWNKFWGGFYERGIEVIGKINAYMDAQTIGKKLAGAITEQLKAFGTGDIGGRIDYIRNSLKVVTDEELLALQNYLEGLSHISSDQEQILRRIKAETDARKQAVIDQKEQAEIEAKKNKELEEQENKEKELAELRKKQAEEREKALKVQSEWEQKLFNIRIDVLDKTREKELENESLTQEQKIEVDKFYGDMILAMRLKQIETEREEALKQENLTKEAELAIESYYENRKTQVRNEEAEKRYKAKEEEVKEEEKIEKKSLQVMVNVAMQQTKNIAKIFKQVASTVKKVFSEITEFVRSTFEGTKNAFAKLFDFNIDEALNKVLEFEDKVLTFFVETLPQLPYFAESVFTSIITLLDTLIENLDWNKIGKLLDDLIKAFARHAPRIIRGIVEIFKNIIGTVVQVLIDNSDLILNAIGEMVFAVIEALPALIQSVINALGTFLKSIGTYIVENGEKITEDIVAIVHSIVDGIVNFIQSGGFKAIVKAWIVLFRAINEAWVKNLDTLVEAFLEGLPDFMEALLEAIVIASKASAKTMKPLVRLIVKFILGLIEVAFSQEALDASMEVAEEFLAALIEVLITEVPRVLPKLIVKIVAFIIKSIPKSIIATVKAIAKVITETDWGDVAWGFVEGLRDAFFEIGNELWPVFEWFGNAMKTVFGDGWDWVVNSATWAWNQITEGFKWAFEGIGYFFKQVIDGIKWGLEQIKSTMDSMASGWNWFWGGPSSWFGWANGTNNAPKGLALVGEQGPELIKFNGGEQVLNTRNTQKALEGAGKSTNNFNVTFNNLQDTTAFTMMNQLKQYNRQMAINGVI